MTGQKRVYLKAYTSMNLGDDLFVRIICSRYPKTQFYLIASPRFDRAFKELPNLKVLKSVSLINSLCKKLRFKVSFFHKMQKWVSSRCNAVVYIGGSIFTQLGDWKLRLADFEEFLSGNANAYVIGCNFGPYLNKEYLDGCRQLFSRLTDICFRDRYSYGLFSELSCARYAPDVIFSCHVDGFEKTAVKKQVLISVLDLNRRERLRVYTSVYEQKLIDIINALTGQGYGVKLMAFCQPEGDTEAIRRIIGSGKLHTAHLVSSYIYQGDVDEALTQISESSGVIATRFHAMILGFLFQKPVFPITYTEKTRYVMQDMAFEGLSVDISKMETVEVTHYLSIKKYNIDQTSDIIKQLPTD